MMARQMPEKLNGPSQNMKPKAASVGAPIDNRRRNGEPVPRECRALIAREVPTERTSRRRFQRT